MLIKRTLVLTLTIILLMSSIVVQAASSSIDKSQISSGIVKINFKSNATAAVRIEKGNQKKDHILGSNNSFPLQFGEGQYTITVLENVSGNQFRQVEKEVVNYKSGNKNDLYLQSIQMVNWNNDMNSVKKAKEITKNANTTMEKVTAIHKYIVENIKYNNNKAANIKPGYISSIDLTLQEGNGICYDYSALFAGMARSLNIPTKLVEGRKNDIDVYHAWNQVYIKETNQWIIVDTTYDAALKKANKPINIIKNATEYKMEKEY